MKSNTMWWVLGGIIVLAVTTLFIVNNKEVSKAPDATQNETEQTTDTTPANTNSVGTIIQSGTVGTTQPGTVDANNVLLVAYTENGFEPSEFQVRTGSEVRFENRSSDALRVVGTQFNGADAYPAFDASDSVGRGGSYTFTFTKTGVWAFKNLNEETHVGTVVVFEQNQN